MIRLFLLIFAIVSAAGAYRLYELPNERTREPVAVAAIGSGVVTVEPGMSQEPEIQTIRVLAAQRQLWAGDRLRSGDLYWIEWPIDFVPSYFIQQIGDGIDEESFVGMVLTGAFEVNEPIHRDLLVDESERQVLQPRISQTLSSGMRAVSVSVDQDAAAGGFVLPGDRVDVIHSIFPENGAPAQSRVVVYNARVIAVDQITETDGSQSIALTRNATLELDEAEAAAVASAQQTGALTLALRAYSDANEQAEAERSLSDTLPAGMRAVVVPQIDLVSGAIFTPGSRVDVTQTTTNSVSGQVTSRLIATNVRVLAVEQMMGGENRGGDDQYSVTLELDRAGVEIVTAARAVGAISLTLRSSADSYEQPSVLPANPGPQQIRVRRGSE